MTRSASIVNSRQSTAGREVPEGTDGGTRPSDSEDTPSRSTVDSVIAISRFPPLASAGPGFPNKVCGGRALPLVLLDEAASCFRLALGRQGSRLLLRAPWITSAPGSPQENLTDRAGMSHSGCSFAPHRPGCTQRSGATWSSPLRARSVVTFSGNR